jgi:LacI family transcriptional regulator
LRYNITISRHKQHLIQKKEMKKVILIIDTSRALGRQFLTGIEYYIQTHNDWETHIKPLHNTPSGKPHLNTWVFPNHTDGFIVCDSPQSRNFLNIKIPKILFDSNQEAFPGTTSISSDNYTIGKIAAEYFIGLGFSNFSYCGFSNLYWSNIRFLSYKKALELKNIFHVFNYQSHPDNGTNELNNISNWLKSLPKPNCVFACNDELGFHVLDACKIADIKVPEEIAVLGVDNDELVCNLSLPPLSSIKLGFEKSGFEAAEELDKQMKGCRPAADILVKPQDLIKRQSSDIIAVNDTDIRKALVFIGQNFQKPIQVDSVVKCTSLSRRMLERRFNRYLKRSINDEINRLRIQYIKNILSNSDNSIRKIAESLEYTDVEHFSRFFKKITTLSPIEYRRKFGKHTK